jgi:hypothetical protein
MWRSPCVKMSRWQPAHWSGAVTGWGGGGGRPWHCPQVAAGSFIQSGRGRVAPPSVTPWQYVVQLTPSKLEFTFEALATVPKKSSAGEGSMWPGSSIVAGTR